MKKMLLLILMVVGTTMAYGQIKNQIVENVQASEMELFTQRLLSSNENLAFTKNQTAKLERVFLNKAREIVTLRKAELGKDEYSIAHAKIDDKYEPKIIALLSTEQKIEYRKMNDKKVKVSNKS